MIRRAGGAQSFLGVLSSMSPPRKEQGSCAAPTAQQQQERSGFSPVTESSSKSCGLDLPGKKHTTLNISV